MSGKKGMNKLEGFPLAMVFMLLEHYCGELVSYSPAFAGVILHHIHDQFYEDHLK